MAELSAAENSLVVAQAIEVSSVKCSRQLKPTPGEWSSPGQRQRKRDKCWCCHSVVVNCFRCCSIVEKRFSLIVSPGRKPLSRS